MQALLSWRVSTTRENPKSNTIILIFELIRHHSNVSSVMNVKISITLNHVTFLFLFDQPDGYIITIVGGKIRVVVTLEGKQLIDENQSLTVGWVGVLALPTSFIICSKAAVSSACF